MSYLNKLPNEIIINILLYLNFEHIIIFRITCKKFYNICNLIFSKSLYVLNKSKSERLLLLKKIYFVENDININNNLGVLYINYVDKYFEKFSNDGIKFYYNLTIWNSIIDCSNGDIHITIFSRYILKNFKNNYEYKNNKKIYNKVIFKHFVNNIIDNIMDSEHWIRFRCLYIILPNEFYKYKDLETENIIFLKDYDMINYINENYLLTKNNIYIERILKLINLNSVSLCNNDLIM